MSLENLKSAFSNIVMPEPGIEKQGKSVNDLTSGVQQTFPTSPDVSSKPSSDLTKMVSEYSIQGFPQEIDYLNNERATGFTARHKYPNTLFTGVEGQESNLTFSGNTLAYTDRDIEWPGPVNFLSDQKATGFTLDQVHKSPSRFVGASGTPPDMTWSNDIDLGGSLYGIEVNPQEYDEMSNIQHFGFRSNRGDNLKDSLYRNGSHIIGFGADEWTSTTDFYTVDNVTFPGPVDFFLGANSYYGEVNPNPEFTNEFNIGGYTFGTGQLGNSKYIGISTGTNQDYHDISRNLTLQEVAGNNYLTSLTGWNNEGFIGFTSRMGLDSKSTQLRLYDIETQTWTDTFTDLTKFENFNGNFNTDGSVDFLGGNNSYYNSLSTEISGFTKQFGILSGGQNTAGWTNSVGQLGISKFLTSPDGEQFSAIPTGTHTRPDWDNSQVTLNTNSGNFGEEDGASNFPGIPNPLDGTWNTDILNPATSYYDGINEFGGHSVNPISDTMYGPVNFLGGVNSYYAPVNIQQNEASEDIAVGIPGFTNNFGVTVDGQDTSGYNFSDGNEGNSKYLTYTTDDGGNIIPDGNFISTGTHSRPLRDGSDTTVNFPGTSFSAPNFPGGQSVTTPLGLSNYIEELTNDLGEGTGEYNMIPTSYQDIYSSLSTDNIPGFDGDDFNDIFTESTVRLRSTNSENPDGFVVSAKKSDSFDILYNTSPWQQSAKEVKYAGPVQAGSNISNLERFNLKSDLWQSSIRNKNGNTSVIDLFSLGQLDDAHSITQGEYGGWNEPYIVDEIGRVDQSEWTEDYWPKTALQKDTIRIAKFLGSYAGSEFTAKMLLMGTYQTYSTIYDPGSTLVNTALPAEGLALPIINIRKDHGITGGLLDLAMATTYSEWLDRREKGQSSIVQAQISKPDMTYAERDVKHRPLADLIQNGLQEWISSWGGTTGGPLETAGVNRESGISSTNNMTNHMKAKARPLGSVGLGDQFTLFPISDFLTTVPATNPFDDVGYKGMPFYFKDLRDGKIVTFRAYIEGLSETLSPSWNSETYIGRSEPVYTYTSTEREVNFTLKLFAQTKDELNMIYQKMNRLTSMTYPEYAKDFRFGSDEEGTVGGQQANANSNSNEPASQDAVEVSSGGKFLPKAPLVKMRMGDLFGGGKGATIFGASRDTKVELGGFIKSLSYNYPDNGVWEIKEGNIVPKYIECSIGYQIIHSSVPSLEFALEGGDGFYGYGKDFTEQTQTQTQD